MSCLDTSHCRPWHERQQTIGKIAYNFHQRTTLCYGQYLLNIGNGHFRSGLPENRNIPQNNCNITHIPQHWGVLRYIAVCCSMFRYGLYCGMLRCVAVYCGMLRFSGRPFSVPHRMKSYQSQIGRYDSIIGKPTMQAKNHQHRSGGRIAPYR
jgi:hypothetical protein